MQHVPAPRPDQALPPPALLLDSSASSSSTDINERSCEDKAMINEISIARTGIDGQVALTGMMGVRLRVPYGDDGGAPAGTVWGL